jgi:hypothetical protein
VNLRDFSLEIKNTFSQFKFEVGAKQQILKDIFSQVFVQLPEIFIAAEAKGKLPSFPLQIDSNLGRELAKALESQLRVQIEKIKRDIQLKIESEIEKKKQALERDILALRQQVQGEIEKLQKQADNEKNRAEENLKTTQRATENQAKSQLIKQGDKALKELKKKLKF